MRRATKVAVLVVALGLVFGLTITLLAPPTSDRPRDVGDQEPQLFHPTDDASGFYPYLNSRPAFGNLSPVNVVVTADLNQTLNVLQERPGATWNTTVPAREGPNQTGPLRVNLTGTEIGWGQATGSARYAYVDNGSHGEWVRESAQLHDGTYFGFRYHLRLYADPSPNASWVAIQAHSEHFDWFTLRHAVDGIEDAQNHVEGDLMGQSYVENVKRTYLDNAESSDSDGWATVVDLLLVAPLVALGALRAPPTPPASTTFRDVQRRIQRRLTPRHGVLAVTVAALLLGVRVAGLAIERGGPDLSPHQIAGLLYPVLALGLPIATYLVARSMERRMDAGLTAAGALGAAILADYAYLGVDVLPIDLVVHRVVLVVALGLIAAGSARRAWRQSRFNKTLATGTVLWVVLLFATLAGWV